MQLDLAFARPVHWSVNAHIYSNRTEGRVAGKRNSFRRLDLVNSGKEDGNRQILYCSRFSSDTWLQVGGGEGEIDEAEEAVSTAGLPLGNGLTKMAAEEFGLCEGIAVGSGLIDA